ncbi:thioesterase family protein [Lacisediminimonas sp.]|uniref:acyl-CoA thioesterase n=1 Tax=Lacisediminimonas sp. TaxID=3060582 RepID=UPI002721867E|nr:thioesterase family protein [Lacisediminimonas sp.]MDO8300601.1 thioesterase family protein [Lacisediminimonas sp.]
MNARTPPSTRADYFHFCQIATRWMDNDMYGHVNNVVYYAYFDTAVNQYLIEQGVLDPVKAQVIGLVVETQCRYYSSLAFPDVVHVGVRVGHVGTSSVRYELGVFRNDEQSAAAEGHFVHVYVDRESNRPVRLPDDFGNALAPLRVSDAGPA